MLRFCQFGSDSDGELVRLSLPNPHRSTKLPRSDRHQRHGRRGRAVGGDRRAGRHRCRGRGGRVVSPTPPSQRTRVCAAQINHRPVCSSKTPNSTSRSACPYPRQCTTNSSAGVAATLRAETDRRRGTRRARQGPLDEQRRSPAVHRLDREGAAEAPIEGI